LQNTPKRPTDMQKPSRKSGLARILAAAEYSTNGAARMLREAAFRQELIAGGVILVLFALKGADLWAYGGFVILGLMVLATEALNTAIEEVVDHVSPDWAAFARNAKDLGSFAAACQMLAAGIFALYVLLS
jgi:diacylglycerol kinase (ATP)